MTVRDERPNLAPPRGAASMHDPDPLRARPIPPESSPALVVRGLQLTRGTGFSLSVDALELAAGDCVAIAGPSGCGKSSLLDAVIGLRRPGDPLHVTGEVHVGGRPRAATDSAAHRAWLRELVAVVPQDARAALDPLASLGEQLVRHLGPRADADIDGAFARLGLATGAAFRARRPHEISGGQAQRVLLALALLRQPALCLCDEPTAGLDAPRVAELATAFGALRAASSRTALLVLGHDHDFAARLGARRLCLAAGRLREDDPEPEPWPRRGPAVIGDPLLACRDLELRLGARTIVRELSLELREGEIVALLGPSGAGKTTLARALAGHLRPHAGAVHCAVPRRAVQLLFQDAAGSLTPGRSIRRLCEEVAARGTAIEVLAERLGLGASLLERSVEGLSGGERRRAALLRALVAAPRVLVLDEPTSNLDRARACEVVELLLERRAHERCAMLWITHDDGLAAHVADRIVRLEEMP